MDAWFDRLTALMSKLQAALPWVGYLVVSVVGGVAAYLKEMEDKNPEMTLRQRTGMLGRKLFFAIFAGMLWYQIVVSQNMSGSPFSYIGASLVGLYATEFLDFLWGEMKKRLGTRKE